MKICAANGELRASGTVMQKNWYMDCTVAKLRVGDVVRSSFFLGGVLEGPLFHAERR